MNFKNKKEELETIINKNGLFPERFLLINGDNFIYSQSNKKHTKKSLCYKKINLLKSTKYSLNRGKVLEDILIIEYILSQIGFIKLAGDEIVYFNHNKIDKWNKFLSELSFHQKIKLLDSWDLFTENEEKELFNKIKDFRNKIAHSISFKYIEYNNMDLNNNFDKFEKDILKVTNILIKIYNMIWNKNDLDTKTIAWIKDNYNIK